MIMIFFFFSFSSLLLFSFSLFFLVSLSLSREENLTSIVQSSIAQLAINTPMNNPPPSFEKVQTMEIIESYWHRSSFQGTKSYDRINVHFTFQL